MPGGPRGDLFRPLPPDMTPDKWIAQRIIVAPSGCWVWMRTIDRDGYGVASYRGKTQTAQRLAYRTFVDEVIPEGYQIDHLCRYRRCVNPRHLEAVPVAVNFQRGTCPAARRARSDRCIRGHSYAEFGVYHNGGRGGRMRRRCSECIRILSRERAAGRRAARAAA